MPTIHVDGKSYDVPAGHDLLHVCLSLGFDLPYFCWHPALGSVGSCRLCAVKQFRDENDTQGRLVMSCMTPASDGTRISIDDAEAREFRESVVELLMVNHPHDCPVCDEGGECHLQDMTVMTGHNYREYRFEKRTHNNQYLGPFINHEMNRCIQCYRCVRFYRDFADGRDFDVFAAHDHVYFGRHEDGVLENEFSGNLVEVCPTGVFTDKTLKQHYTRKWDLQTAPSVCVHCSVGCNTIPGERYGALRRVYARYNGEVNRYFLCDRGRYGYEFVNSERRMRQPLVRGDDGTTAPVSKEDALAHLQKVAGEANAMIGIGSPRASLEANFALRQLVGPDRFFHGTSDSDQRLVSQMLSILQNGPASTPSLHEIEQADAVLVLGEDVTNTAPMVALALRQAVRQQPMETTDAMQIPRWNDAAVREVIQDRKGPLFIAAAHATRLDDVARQTFRAAPDDVARLGFAVAAAIDDSAPVADGLSDETTALAREIADALLTAKRPLVVSGSGAGSEAVLQAAANVAWALCRKEHPAKLSLSPAECNSLGLALMEGGSLQAALQAVEQGEADTVVVLENDLYRRASPETVDALFEKAKAVIAIDHLANGTTHKADVVLPAATFAEGDGTLVNNEGRAQRFFQVFVPEGDIQESWRWVRDLAAAAGSTDCGWNDLDDVLAALAAALPVFAPVPEIAPPGTFRVVGEKIPRQSHRYSGRTAMQANVNVHEPKPPDDPDSPLSFSMEGYAGEPPAALIPRFWAPGWNSVQSINKFQSEVGGPLHGGDPGRRLIEPGGDQSAEERATEYFADVPPPFAQRPQQWFVVGLHHIFGSEELSVLTPGVAERSPEAYLALHPDDAAALNLAERDAAVVRVCGGEFHVPVRCLPSLPRGVAGLPVGLPELRDRGLPAWGTIAPGGDA